MLQSLFSNLFTRFVILASKFDLPISWCFVWYTEYFHNLDFSSNFTILHNKNVDNFDITTHVHWFWIVWTKCWNWDNWSFCKIQGIEFLIQTVTSYLFICYIVSCISVYQHMRKNTKPVQSENLTSGQLFFKKRFYLVGLREQLY